MREIAEVIGRRLGVPTASVPVERVAEHFAPFPFAAMDVTTDSAATRELLGREPVEVGLTADLEQGHYFGGERGGGGAGPDP